MHVYLHMAAIESNTACNRPLLHGGHFESRKNKKLCFCTSSHALDERLAVQNLLFQHCVLKAIHIQAGKLDRYVYICKLQR